jgi:hypothetical protein
LALTRLTFPTEEARPGADLSVVQVFRPAVLFDDTQDNANHIHSLWRDFNGDFGGDLLKAHYETSHRNQKG